MNRLLFASFLLMPFLAMGIQGKVILKLETHRDNPRHRSLHVFEITQTKNQVTCKTQDVPSHRIAVDGFAVEAPFKSEKIADRCESAISWNKKTACYKKFENPLVDQVIRACRTF